MNDDELLKRINDLDMNSVKSEWQSGYKTTVEEFDRWLAQVKAEAWDEGRLVGLTHNRQENPYRKELK